MQVNEAFRRIVLGHIRLLLVCILLGAGAATLIGSAGPAKFQAHARLQASSEAIGSDTEADSVLNRVRGVATSPDIVAAALAKSKVTDRSAQQLADHQITVTRLGSSAVVDIVVTDRDSHTAMVLASALANQVVEFLRGPGSVASQGLLQQLQTQQQQLYTKRTDLVAQLAGTPDAAHSAPISAQISTIDQQLADIAATVRQLQLAAATGSSATVISTAATAVASHSDRTLRIVLGLAAGLVAGLLAAALVEIVRPRVADAHRFADELGVPMLGTLQERRVTESPADSAGDDEQWRRARARYTYLTDAAGSASLSRAIARAGAEQIVLVAAGTKVGDRRLAASLGAQLAAREAENDSRAGARRARNGDAVPNGEPAYKYRQISPAHLGAVPGGATAADPTRGGIRTAPPVTAAGLWVPVQAPAQVAPSPGLRVGTIDDVHPGTDRVRRAIVVVAAPLAGYSTLRGVADLASATDWPVLGVLSIKRRARR